MRNISDNEYARAIAQLTNEYGEPVFITYYRWKVGNGSVYLHSNTPNIQKFVATGKTAPGELRKLFGKPNSVDTKGYPAWELVVMYATASGKPSRAVECAHCGLMYATDHEDDNGYCATCIGKGVVVKPVASALDIQVGGDHYKQFPIQPAEFCQKNKLSFLASCAIKRLCRFDKGGKGLEDLEKAKHEIDLLIEIEGWGR